jgi:hypothetical protein
MSDPAEQHPFSALRWLFGSLLIALCYWAVLAAFRPAIFSDALLLSAHFIRGVPLGLVLLRGAAISWPPVLVMLLLAWRMRLARHAGWIWLLLVPGAMLINGSGRFIVLVISLVFSSA